MADFPLLKSGAVVQYPIERSLLHPSRVLRFIDGAEQSFRTQASALKRWVVTLALLDEDEQARIDAFFDQAGGRLNDFSFEDPWDSVTHASCRLESDELKEALVGEGRSTTRLVIRQNRTS